MKKNSLCSRYNSDTQESSDSKMYDGLNVHFECFCSVDMIYKGHKRPFVKC